MLSSHLCLGIPSGLFPSGFPNKPLYPHLLCPMWCLSLRFPQQTPVPKSLVSHTCHMPCPSHKTPVTVSCGALPSVTAQWLHCIWGNIRTAAFGFLPRQNTKERGHCGIRTHDSNIVACAQALTCVTWPCWPFTDLWRHVPSSGRNDVGTHIPDRTMS